LRQDVAQASACSGELQFVVARLKYRQINDLQSGFLESVPLSALADSPAANEVRRCTLKRNAA
jgi:hypothetical protein